MQSHEDESRLSAWLDGELGSEAARSVESHLGRCTRCQELVVAFREMRESLVSTSRVEADPGFVARFRAHRDELSIAPFWTWRQLAMHLVPVALAVLVLALGSVWVASRHEPESAPDLQVLESEAIGSPTFLARTAPEPVLEIVLEPFPGEVP